MTYLPIGYLAVLGEARSCLAALPDSNDDVDLSAHFDRLLTLLDIIPGDAGPACSPMSGTRAELVDRLKDAVDCLVECGVDGLSLELLLLAASDGPVS